MRPLWKLSRVSLVSYLRNALVVTFQLNTYYNQDWSLYVDLIVYFNMTHLFV
jgi:hypothetical protein